MTNTEKPSTKAEQKKNIVNTPKQTKEKPIQKPIKKEEVKEEETKKEGIEEKIKEEKVETKIEEKSKEKKDTTIKTKKDYAIVNGKSLPISAKDAKHICKFIKNKTISKAIKDLEKVLQLKKAVPMKGEIPHRKGKIMSGRFPHKASTHFIVLLKSLQGNANMHEVENPFICEAISNTAQRPFGRAGIKRKRTHVKIKAMTKKEQKSKEENKQGDKKQEEKK